MRYLNIVLNFVLYTSLLFYSNTTLAKGPDAKPDANYVVPITIDTKAIAEKVKESKAEQPLAPELVDPDDFGGIVKQIIHSAKTGKWGLLIGFIIMLLTWVVNRVLKNKIPSAVMPWLAIGLSTIAAVSFSKATGAGWIDAIVVGVQNGLVAAGSWSALGKYLPLLSKKS